MATFGFSPKAVVQVRLEVAAPLPPTNVVQPLPGLFRSGDLRSDERNHLHLSSVPQCTPQLADFDVVRVPLYDSLELSQSKYNSGRLLGAGEPFCFDVLQK